jgi:DNA-binding response OmpR family regulator
LVAIARGRHLRLPRRVLFLLFELASAPGRVRTRAELAERAWESGARRVKLKSVDQAVSRLRRTLKEVLPEIEYIHTQTGVGYRFLREKPKGKRSR